MNFFERAILIGVPVGLAAAELLARATGLASLPFLLFSPFYSFPLLTVSAVVTAFATMRRTELLPFLLLSIVFEGAKTLLIVERHRDVLDSWSTMGIGIWYASVLLAAWRTFRARGAERLFEADRGLLRLALPIGVCLSLFGLWLTGQHVPFTLDNFYYAFDGLLALPLAHWMAGLCRRFPTLWGFATVAYQSFWVVLSLFIFAQCRTDQKLAGRLMSRWILAGLLGWLLYLVVPGAGPEVAFRSRFGDMLPAPMMVELIPLQVVENRPRNAMPSLHMTWALLLALAGWEMGRTWFTTGTLFAALTVFSTLGLEEHYLIDLLVSVPFTVMVYDLPSLFERKGRREAVTAVAGGAALTALLLLVIRFGTEPLRAAPWAANLIVIAVIALAFLLHRRSAGPSAFASDPR